MTKNRFFSVKTAFVLAQAIILVVFIKSFVISPYILFGESMEKTHGSGDVLIALKSPALNLLKTLSKSSYNFLISDRVVIITGENFVLAKRCVGTEGDTLLFQRGFSTDTVVVPENSVFLLGDNYRNSLDSRAFGCVNESSITGISILSFKGKRR